MTWEFHLKQGGERFSIRHIWVMKREWTNGTTYFIVKFSLPERVLDWMRNTSPPPLAGGKNKLRSEAGSGESAGLSSWFISGLMNFIIIIFKIIIEGIRYTTNFHPKPTYPPFWWKGVYCLPFIILHEFHETFHFRG